MTPRTPPAPAVDPAVPADPVAPVAPMAGPTPQGPAADLATLLDEPSAQPWYRRRAVWAAVLLLLALTAALAVWQARRSAAAAPVYISQVVARGTLTLKVVANGTLQPTRTVNIGSELSGTVLKVHVDVNDRIRKGQVLVELDTAKLGDQVLRSRAAVSAAAARLAQTAATLKEARASLARLEEVARLSGGRLPSKAELDGARAVLERTVADEAGARAGVADAMAALSTDEINRGKASIRAPSAGVVLTRNVDPGNAVAASLQAVTLFTVAEDLAQLRLQVYVDEADVGRVTAGQEASFTVSAHADRHYPARVTRVAFGSTITDNVVTYLSQLDVDNRDLSLRPGMTATATITALRRDDVLLVPNSALRFTPGARDAVASAPRGGIATSLIPRLPSRGGTRRSATGGDSAAAARQVWVQRDGAAVAVAVIPGISDGRMTEITGGELREGMLVITNQQAAAP